MFCFNMRRVLITSIALVLSIVANLVNAEYEIKQWTIASGGVIEAVESEWMLFGTIGQWEAQGVGDLSGGPWTLTGGFWGTSLEDLDDDIFSDSFQTFVRYRRFRESGEKNLSNVDTVVAAVRR